MTGSQNYNILIICHNTYSYSTNWSCASSHITVPSDTSTYNDWNHSCIHLCTESTLHSDNSLSYLQQLCRLVIIVAVLYQFLHIATMPSNRLALPCLYYVRKKTDCYALCDKLPNFIRIAKINWLWLCCIQFASLRNLQNKRSDLARVMIRVRLG